MSDMVERWSGDLDRTDQEQQKKKWQEQSDELVIEENTIYEINRE